MLSYQFPKTSSLLLPTEGTKLFSTNSGISVRALYSIKGLFFAVIDDGLYSVNTTTGAASNLGTLNTVTGLCDIIANTTQIMITDGTYAYVYNYLTGIFTQITDADFPNNAIKLTYQDGYGIMNQGGTSNWFLSDLNNFTSWNSINEGSTVSLPDNLVSLVSVHSQLIVIDQYDSEVWVNTGAAIFPFQKSSNTLIQCGTPAPYTVSVLDNTIYYLAQDRTGSLSVISLNGYVPTEISSEWVCGLLDHAAQIGDISTCFAFSYGRNGHLFYVLQIPVLDRTIVYDTKSQEWHERKSVKAPQYDTNGRWLANCYTYLNGKHYVGDYQSGNIYELDGNTFTDNGQPIIRERTTSVTCHPEKFKMFVSRFEIDADMGDGLASGQGSDPILQVEVSTNGGRTFSKKIFVPLGKIGAYKNRAQISRVGMSNAFVFRLTFSDPVFCSLFNAVLTADMGENP